MGNPSKPTLLIDGDILAYQMACQAETPTEWDEDFWTLHADAKIAKQHLDDAIHQLVDRLDASHADVCLSCPTGHYFRHDIYPDYKNPRKKNRKPLILKTLKEHLIEEWGATHEDNLEADDLLGLLQEPDGSTIIVSIDKDMLTIPGLVYNPSDPNAELKDINLEEADYNHLYQTLVGDSTDNYGGCPGVGPVGADKALAKGATWDTVMKQFQKKSISEEDALVQARLARILRKGEYDFDKKEVKLWTP